MKCGYCGKTLKEDAQFCSNCGRSLQEIDDGVSESGKNAKGAYAFSILALIMVFAIVGYGGFVMVYRDLHPEKTVSSSDQNTDGFNYDAVYTDSSIVGKWLCTDRAAADYGDKNFGVEVRIVLELTEDGSFTLDYSMTDTGITARSLSTSGKYSTEDGMITFVPEENPGIDAFLKVHGQNPSFGYAVGEEGFSLKYENGKDISFTRYSE